MIQSSIVLSLTTVPAGPSLTTDCREGPPRQWFHVSILTLTTRLFPARAFTLGTMSCSSIVHVFEWCLYCSGSSNPHLNGKFHEMFRLIYGRGLLSLAFCDANGAVYLFTVLPQGKILCRSINGALKPLDQLLHQTVWVWSARLVSFPVASIRIKISQILNNFKWIELLINIRREASKHNQCRVKSSSNVLSLMQLSREETVNTRHSWRTIY